LAESGTCKVPVNCHAFNRKIRLHQAEKLVFLRKADGGQAVGTSVGKMVERLSTSGGNAGNPNVEKQADR
jgi:hypothetical protein